MSDPHAGTLELYAMPGNEARADALAARLGLRRSGLWLHRFPDGESLVRVQPPGKAVAVVCTLRDPDALTLPLLMAAATLRELGAAQVGLVAPYLAYMRQDRAFEPGQAVSARIYAALLSGHFDWLLTVDPHLHRIDSLDRVYSLRSRVVHAAAAIARWVAGEIAQPLLIGPDAESRQWVAEVARRVGAPMLVLDKQRRGDLEVSSRLPDLRPWAGRTPVLLDDIASSGRTLAVVLESLRGRSMAPAACVVTHGLFALDALDLLRAAGAARIACTDSVEPPPGVECIPLDADLAQALGDMSACAKETRS
jgi:ribose-phosphate pyrophosphokinase